MYIIGDGLHVEYNIKVVYIDVLRFTLANEKLRTESF